MKSAAVIVAAGQSRRMGFDKLMAPLGGIPVLQRTLHAFQQCANLSEIILVTSPERYRQLQLAPAPAPPVRHAQGREERHLSVQAGLNALSTEIEIVAVHDGARPLITPAAIEKALKGAEKFQAVTLARPVTETLKRASESGYTTESVSREHLWAMETPQCFHRALLEQAYHHVLTHGLLVTDEVSALEQLGIPTKVLAHGEPNLKITHPTDLPLAEKLLPNA